MDKQDATGNVPRSTRKELISNGTVSIGSCGTDLVIVLEWLSNDLVT